MISMDDDELMSIFTFNFKSFIKKVNVHLDHGNLEICSHF